MVGSSSQGAVLDNDRPFRVGVVIATHNRPADLRRTLHALAGLSPAPHEIWVCADGCTDGTVELLRADFPQVRLLIHERPLGSVTSRNELNRACECEVLLSLDDDSFPLEPGCITTITHVFQDSPHLGVLSFPQRSDEFPDSLTATDFGPPRFVASYANSAAAIRREAFLQLGGYPDFFFHAYEEPDFALRCLEHGWQVRFEPRITVRHHYTPTGRNELRTHHRHARNELWSVLMRCPFPQVLLVAMFRIVRQAGFASRRGVGWLLKEPAWWMASVAGLRRCLADRAPVSWRVFYSWMRLSKRPMEDELQWFRQFAVQNRGLRSISSAAARSETAPHESHGKCGTVDH